MCTDLSLGFPFHWFKYPYFCQYHTVLKTAALKSNMKLIEFLKLKYNIKLCKIIKTILKSSQLTKDTEKQI